MLSEQLMGEIDRRIARLMPENGRADPIYGMVKYHLGWVDEHLRPSWSDPGKRIRSRLCLLVCAAVGAPPVRALAPATAVELIHNFSLLHDDIQDRSEYRRHRRTVWAIWGAAQAINAGDLTFSLAQSALAEDEENDPVVVVRALRALNRACQLLVEGQYLDMDFEGRSSVSVDDYYAMIERKTAALMDVSCLLGALYGGAGEAETRAYSSFGKQLGLAFQVQDDYLGIWGDPAKTGKPSADDIASKKKTLPLLHALAEGSESDRGLLRGLMSSPGIATPAEMSAVLGILDRCRTVDYTAAEVARTTQLALDALATASPEPLAHQALASLCHRLRIRTR